MLAILAPFSSTETGAAKYRRSSDRAMEIVA
jgi:hypothetical protein